MENIDNSTLGTMVMDIISSHVNGTFHTSKLRMSVIDFVKAVMIIATSNSCKAQYLVPVNNHCSNTYDILILESNASVINELIKAGYSLSMTPKGLSVDKY